MQTALVVVDMLNDFVDGVLANPAARHIVEPIASLLHRARPANDWVVLYANDAHGVTDRELRVFPPHAMAGTPGAEVIDELRPVLTTWWSRSGSTRPSPRQTSTHSCRPVR